LNNNNNNNNNSKKGFSHPRLVHPWHYHERDLLQLPSVSPEAVEEDCRDDAEDENDDEDNPVDPMDVELLSKANVAEGKNLERSTNIQSATVHHSVTKGFCSLNSMTQSMG